jgi:hypothetical protein
MLHHEKSGNPGSDRKNGSGFESSAFNFDEWTGRAVAVTGRPANQRLDLAVRSEATDCEKNLLPTEKVIIFDWWNVATC